MKGRKIFCIFLFVVLILIFSSCHARHVSDIKPGMTKEEVVSLWGKASLTSYKIVNGRTFETWEYYHSKSDSICWIDFFQDTVVASECRPRPGGGWFWQ